jgi:hypothetical protein
MVYLAHFFVTNSDELKELLTKESCEISLLKQDVFFT